LQGCDGIRPIPPALAKRHWFSVYLENHLNLVIAQTIRYLIMSSLAAFRSLRVVKKLGDEIFGS
jgi:predicted DNA-binding protein (MmcQ/YjbR family)